MEAFDAVLPQKLPLQLDAVFGDVVDLRAWSGGSTFLLWGDAERGGERVAVVQVHVVSRLKRRGRWLGSGAHLVQQRCSGATEPCGQILDCRGENMALHREQ